MTDEEWSAYLASERAAASRARYQAWVNRERAKLESRLQKREEALSARHARERRLFEDNRRQARESFHQRAADYENKLLADDFKALGLKPGRG